jgi:hypothetical protein
MNSQLDGASAGAHTQNQAEADVLAFLGNITVTHQLNNLEELFDVEVLLAGNDIEHLVELVLLGLFFFTIVRPIIVQNMRNTNSPDQATRSHRESSRVLCRPSF